MNVKKVTINRNKLNTDGFINIPLELNFDTTDKNDTVLTNYFEVEKEKAINPINDFEKCRFTPLNGNTRVQQINFILNFVKNGAISNNSVLSDLEFVQDDIYFKKNNFTKSFLRLNFYDTDKLTTQKLVNFYTIHLRILKEYVQPSTGVMVGTPMPVNTIPVKFRIKDPVIFLDDYSEGFNIYHYRDEVDFSLPKELFMRATFNNAKNGIIYNLMTENTAQDIGSLIQELHMRYVLTRDNSGFFYEIDTAYSNNVVLNGDEITIKLYETISL